jgi:hypothetical protein
LDVFESANLKGIITNTTVFDPHMAQYLPSMILGISFAEFPEKPQAKK